MKIGVFDSGRGGELVASGLQLLLPRYEFMVVNDRAHVPYGSRSNREIIQLTTAAIQPLIAAHCSIIVIACNTATMVAIQHLRKQFPTITFIGTDPMVKPAALTTKTRHITVLATPRTFKSPRYRQLRESYASRITIDQPSTENWATVIENNQLHELDFTDVTTSIANGSDTLVLACTHYIALVPQFKARFPSATILEPTSAIARRIATVISEL